MDHWEFNKVNVKNRYPLPIIDECMDQLMGFFMLCKIDMRSGYHHI